MKQARIFGWWEGLIVTAAALLAYELASYLAYALVSVLIDGNSLSRALAVGLSPGWGAVSLLFPLGLVAVLLPILLSRARRPHRRVSYAVVATALVVGGVRLLILAVNGLLLFSGAIQYTTPGAGLMTFLSEVVVSLVVIAAAVSGASVGVKFLRARSADTR